MYIEPTYRHIVGVRFKGTFVLLTNPYQYNSRYYNCINLQYAESDLFNSRAHMHTHDLRVGLRQLIIFAQSLIVANLQLPVLYGSYTYMCVYFAISKLKGNPLVISAQIVTMKTLC